MNDDDELTRILRASNPARTPKDAPPDAAALAVRERILGTAAHSRARTVPRMMFAAAAAVVVVAVVSLAAFLPRGAAMAVTPVPIVFTETGSISEVVGVAQSKLSSAAGPVSPARHARSESWGLSVDVEEQRVEIVPQVMTLEWNEDLSGRMTVVAGEPYWPHGTPPSGVASADVGPGDVLSEMTFAEGQFGTPVSSLPGDSREDMLALLAAFGLPSAPTASDVLQAMTGVFEQWTLTNAQHAQLLSILVATDGLTVLGRGEDRAGRQIVGLAMDSIYPGVKDQLLISAETGRIVGVESTRVTPDGIVPAGAVISYRLWDTA